jgi:hypothetical protein
VVWRIFAVQLRKYEPGGWRSGKSLAKREKNEFEWQLFCGYSYSYFLAQQSLFRGGAVIGHDPSRLILNPSFHFHGFALLIRQAFGDFLVVLQIA